MIYRFRGWHKGDKCPECGSRKMSRIMVYEDRVFSDGRIYERNIEESNVKLQKFICEECERKLYKFPYMASEEVKKLWAR